MAADDDRIGTQANRVLSRYAMVWVWSVLFGAGTGSFYFYTALARSGGWKGGDLLVGIFVLLAGCTGLLSLVQLLWFLNRVLIPLLFEPEIPERAFYGGARLLSRSAVFLITSLLLGLSGILVQFGLSALR